MVLEGVVGVHPVAEDSVEDVVVVVVVALVVAVVDVAHPEAEGDLEEAGVAVDSEAAAVEVNNAIIFVHISYTAFCFLPPILYLKKIQIYLKSSISCLLLDELMCQIPIPSTIHLKRICSGW